ncbi:MAG: PilZ domain-containing protein [Pseudomonadota bacterium]|nr:PilZ domain-containing protein [Pseudomonadota bacterium]
METSNKFEKVTNVQDKFLYFKTLAKEASQIHGIVEDGTKIVLKANRLVGNYLEISPEGKSPLLANSEGVFNFLVARTQFFFRSKIMLVNKSELALDITGDLFQLQRRTNFRLPIPREDQVTVRLDSHNEVPVNLKGVVIDLGLGGCLIEISDSESPLLVDHIITGRLVTPSAILMSFEASLRHKKIDPINKSKITVGIEFKRFLSGGLPELNNLIMDLYRKYFSKFSNNLPT